MEGDKSPCPYSLPSSLHFAVTSCYAAVNRRLLNIIDSRCRGNDSDPQHGTGGYIFFDSRFLILVEDTAKMAVLRNGWI